MPEMTDLQPTRKDMAEFFRLGLVAGLCEPAAVADWAESIVAAEQSPHIAFIELCIAGAQPPSAVQTLLEDVPGKRTPELSARMLLGHSSQMVSCYGFGPELLLLRLYSIARLEAFPENIYDELLGLEDGYCLVRDGVAGTPDELRHHIVTFFNEYEKFAPGCAPPSHERLAPLSAREVQVLIRNILMRFWDPIGVAGVPEAQDEYDSYVGPVHTLLSSGANDTEIIEFLYKTETATMGLTRLGSRSGPKRAVARLRALNSRLRGNP